MNKILEVKDLNISLKKGDQLIPAVNHVSFTLAPQKTLGIIGESGSGKSLTCYGILGLLAKKRWQVEGDVLLKEARIPYWDNHAMASYRGMHMALIMQNPMSAFNPMITIGKHFHESINKPEAPKKSKAEVNKIALEMMTRMRIRDPEAVMRCYSFQLSGGMLQRIMIALAIVMEPDLLIADEPTTSLDLTTQQEILNILHELQENMGTSILLVSHDLSVISQLASDIAVMYAGSFVETGPADVILNFPLHPYTRGLFASRPTFSKERLLVLEGQPPSLTERAEGCDFYPRCLQRRHACLEQTPKISEHMERHKVRCTYC